MQLSTPHLSHLPTQWSQEAMAHAEGEFRDANKRLNEVVKEANTVNQERNTMHTEKRTRDKKLRDAQVSESERGNGEGEGEWSG